MNLIKQILYAGYALSAPRQKFLLFLLIASLGGFSACKSRRNPVSKEPGALQNKSHDLDRDANNIPSSRPLDGGKSFRLGYGYDMLSGERHGSCLDGKFEVIPRSIGSTQSEFSLISTKEELARKLNIELNAEASGSYGVVSGSVSSKTQILRQANFSEQSILGILSLVYLAKELTIEGGKETLSSVNTELLKQDAKTFRLQCGDAFSRSVNTGAAIYVVIGMQSKNANVQNSVETSNSIKAAFGGLFNANASVAVSQEQQELLQNFHLTVTCHSLGANSTACSQPLAGIDPSNFNPLVQFVDGVKAELSKSIESQPELFVSVDEVLEEYPKPKGMEEVKRSDIFMDFSSQAQFVRQLLDREIQVHHICNVMKLKSCVDVQVALANQIRYCARQESFVDCDPNLASIDKLLSEVSTQTVTDTSIGRVTFWEHFQNGIPGGKVFVADFDRPTSDPINFKSNQIYNLSDHNYNDIATGYQSTLREGWQLRVFEHVNGDGRCWMVGAADPQIFNFGWFNDKASSFRLETVGQYPTSC